jgi:DHA2 family lincomycin resistance protein-like MFS transporter
VILSRLDWPWLFIAILPLAIATLVLGYATIKVRSESRRVALDARSLVLSGIGFASLVYGLASLGEGGGHALVSPWTSILVGAVVVAAFVRRQVQLQKFDRAQLDMRPFTVRTFSVATFIMLCFMIACYGMMTLMPVILQTSYGLSTVQAGLFMVPGGVTIAIVSAIVGRLYDKLGARPLVLCGAVVDAAGLYLLSTLAPGTPIELLLGAYLLTIVGQALMWTPLFAASLGVLNPHLLPHGSAIVNTLQQLAGAAGIAIMFSVMGAGSNVYQAAGEAVGPAMAQGAQQAYLVGCGFVLVSLVAVLFLPKRVSAAGVVLPAH